MFLIVNHNVLIRRVILVFELGRSLEHVMVLGVIHNHASFKWKVCFSWILVFDLVILIANNVIKVFLVILDEVKVGQKLGFY